MAVDYTQYPILCVDDEQQNLVTLQYALDDRFQIVAARSGTEALAILAAQPIAILLCDQRMPEMTGLELCERALQVQPETQRMLLTAYSDIDVVIAAINQGRVSRFMLKPWRTEELAQVLETAIDVQHLTRTVRELETKLLADRPQRATLAANAELVHEVANPLAALTMTIAMAREVSDRLLAESDAPRAEIESLHELHADMTAGIGQLNAMLRRLRSGAQHESIVGHCDLQVVAESAVRIVKRALSARAAVVIECEPRIELALDPSVVAEIVINLLMNASEAIERSGLDGRTIRIDGRRLGPRVVLSVRDDGPGLSRSELGMLFSGPANTRIEGRGLGLSIVQQLVRRAGGDIKVSSEPGQGACFEVSLPADPRPAFLSAART